VKKVNIDEAVLVKRFDDGAKLKEIAGEFDVSSSNVETSVV